MEIALEQNVGSAMESGEAIIGKEKGLTAGKGSQRGSPSSQMKIINPGERRG